MGLVGEQLDIDFVISTGDNFYEDGLTGVNDAAFYESFVDIYTAPSLQKQWYNGKLILIHYFDRKYFFVKKILNNSDILKNICHNNYHKTCY